MNDKKKKKIVGWDREGRKKRKLQGSYFFAD